MNYKEGIKFECQGSSNCCVSRGSYGYVYLSKKDMIRLSNFTNLKIKDFVNLYCFKTNGFFHLKEIKKNGDCLFLIDKKCSVYKARPTQCRTWPFWSKNMKSKIWNKDLNKYCPGIGKGKIFSKAEIDNIIKEDDDNENKILNK